MGYAVISESELGVYLSLYSGKVVYLFWNEIEEHKLISKMKTRFEESWPTTWNSIKEDLPPGPTIPSTPQPVMGLIQEGADLHLLTIVDLLLSGIFSRTTGENLLKELGKSKSTPFHKVLIALGIRHVGEGTSKLLSKYYNSLDILGKATLEELTLIEGLGSTRIASIYIWFHTEGNWRTVEKLRLGGFDYAFGYEPPAVRDNLIKDKVFMFTGRLTLFTRNKAQALVEGKGGIAGSSVSKSTDFLVVGERPGSKLAHATLLGTKVISEKDFLEMTK